MRYHQFCRVTRSLIARIITAMLPRITRLFGVVLVFLVGLSAEGQAQFPIPDITTPSVNLLMLDRLMAPGVTIGAEGNLDDRFSGYIQSTIPLKGKLSLGLDQGDIDHLDNPLDVADVLKPDIRQRFLDIGLRFHSLPVLRNSDQVLAAYLGFSGLRYTGHRSFLIWKLRGQFAENVSLQSIGLGVRVSAASGYARFAKSGLLWYAGAYLAYDDGMWVPIPWVGAQVLLPAGHRVRILLPREIQYRYRFERKGLLKPSRWELGAVSRLQMNRFGHGPDFSFFGESKKIRPNTTVLSIRSGAWIGIRVKGSRSWVQLHGGYEPTWIHGFESPTSIWGFAGQTSGGQRWGFGFAELRVVVNAGTGWFDLDLGSLLAP